MPVVPIFIARLEGVTRSSKDLWWRTHVGIATLGRSLIDLVMLAAYVYCEGGGNDYSEF